MNWHVEVKGPNGVKIVEVPAEQVDFFVKNEGSDPYTIAAYLAYMDLWAQ